MGPQGPPGQDGKDGVAGVDGADGAEGAPGRNCWDLDDNLAECSSVEDKSGDGVCDVMDCQGPQGEPGQDGQDGADGAPGADGQPGTDLTLELCTLYMLTNQELPPLCTTLCGNGTQEGWEECDDGLYNSDIDPDACRQNCRLSWCGDGVKDSAEECDLGDLNGESLACEYCSTTCMEGNTCVDNYDSCKATCYDEYLICKAGVHQPGACDDMYYTVCVPACADSYDHCESDCAQ